MERHTLIRAVSKRSDRTQQQLREDLTYFLEEIINALERGESVTLSGFGVFGVRMKKQKVGYDIYRSKPLLIPGGRYIRFEPSRIVRNRILAAAEPSKQIIILEKEALAVL